MHILTVASITSEEAVALAMDLNPVKMWNEGMVHHKMLLLVMGSTRRPRRKTGNVTITKRVFDFKTIVHLSTLHISTRGLTHLALGTVSTCPV